MGVRNNKTETVLTLRHVRETIVALEKLEKAWKSLGAELFHADG